MSELQILKPGGRIKSAYIGLTNLTAEATILNTRTIRSIRKEIPQKFREAFFPRNESQIKQLMGDLGVYRPTIKNDQGMPGQFIPFGVDQTLTTSDLSNRNVIANEGIAIPEPYLEHQKESIRLMQESFLNFDFSQTLEILRDGYHNTSREAGKGRIPYFFIRPGVLDQELIFGKDILTKVQSEVTRSIENLAKKTGEQETSLIGATKPLNMIYGQADVFVDNQGNVVVGEIQTPDVGFFLNSYQVKGAKLLPKVQEITTELEKTVLERIGERIEGKLIYLVTRDEVLANQEDVLELKELERISNGLKNSGFDANIISINQVTEIPDQSCLLLLNLDYSSPAISTLIKKHLEGKINCYPNPIFQKNSQGYFGGQEIVIDPKSSEKYLKLIQPKSRIDSNSIIPTLSQIHKPLTNGGSSNPSMIYHARLGNSEIVPILSNSIHSFGQLHTRITRQPSPELPIVLRVIPFNPELSIIHTEDGPLFHSFRFMFVL